LPLPLFSRIAWAAISKLVTVPLVRIAVEDALRQLAGPGLLLAGKCGDLRPRNRHE
jgi:hypothetical protein